MTLDRWVSLRLVAILAGSALLGLLFTLIVIRDRFEDLEYWLVERQVERVERVLSQEQSEVERMAADYSHWDDTLSYLKGERPEFVEVNFPRNTGENLNVDAVVLRRADGALVLSVALFGDEDYEAWGEAPLAALRQALPAWPADGQLRRDGLMMFIDGRPAFVGRASITDSAMEAPAQGTLAFIRILDDADLERLSGLAGVPFVLEQRAMTGTGLPAIERSGAGWTAFTPLEGGLRLRVDVPGLLSSELYATALALAAMTMLNLVLCVLVVRYVLRRKVTRRLTRFAAMSVQMSQTLAEGERWPVEGDDEIDRLAGAVNHLVDELERHRAALDRLAHEDAVTGLANRRRLLTLLEERLQENANPSAPSSALIYIDLVGFKPINDALGHAAGDTVLRILAERMRALPAPLACATRVGGDEFALLIDGVGLDGAAEWFAGVVDGLVAEVDYAGQRVRFDLVAGIAERPAEGDASAWLSMADLAMYAARRERQGRIGRYSDSLRSAAQTRHLVGTRLREAIEAGGIMAWFQPLVRLEDDAVVGFEALARWHCEGVWVPPAEFIPVAEEEGLMGPLTWQILEQTCDLLVALENAGHPDVVCSINVSPLQVADHRLPEQLMAAVRARGVSPSRIAIEVTEDAIEVRPEGVLETFSAIRRSGFQLWLDDFGIGHASFARLRDYPFDVLKVDRSFTNARGDLRADQLLEGIVQFGQRIGLSVTAEGVETEADRLALRAMGCDRAQGYHIGRPMPAGDILPWWSARTTH